MRECKQRDREARSRGRLIGSIIPAIANEICQVSLFLSNDSYHRPRLKIDSARWMLHYHNNDEAFISDAC